jgi:hypothetical protein
MRLMYAERANLTQDLSLRILGAEAGFGAGGEPGPGGTAGFGFLMRQSSSLAGGSTEMSRNQVAERLLGLPREPAADKGVPFNQVKRGRG